MLYYMLYIMLYFNIFMSCIYVMDILFIFSFVNEGYNWKRVLTQVTVELAPSSLICWAIDVKETVIQ